MSRCLAIIHSGSQCKYKPKSNGLCGIHLKSYSLKSSSTPEPSTEPTSETPLATLKNTPIDPILDPIIDSIIDKKSLQWDYFDPSTPNNETDFITFIPISSFNPEDLFFYHDQNKILWVFPKESFQLIIEKSNKINPYNLLVIPPETISRFNEFISQNPISSSPVENDESVQNKCIQLFQIMDSLDQYTKVDWFMNLNHLGLYNLYRHVEDIWYHRANLSPTDKTKYVHNGTLFIEHPNEVATFDFETLQHYILNEFKRLITEGQTRGECTTGALWILTGFTLVSKNARLALPWLYQSAVST